MYITRLRVDDEGFLAGLDVPFVPGLNVIIGARGTGKTSIIELIRFCLQAGSFTDEAGQRGEQQAMAVLNGGAVTVDLYDPLDQASYSVTRSASGHSSSTYPGRPRITVLAQNEVEAVGAQGAGRLHLVDRLRPTRAADEQERESLRLQLRSLTIEIQDVIREAIELSANLASYHQKTSQLEEARGHQTALLESAKASREDTERLDQYQGMAGRLSLHQARADQAELDLDALRKSVSRAHTLALDLARDWTGDSTSFALSAESALQEVTRAVQDLERADARLAQAFELLQGDQINLTSQRTELEKATRELRQRLSVLQEGVGAASRRVNELEEAVGQANAMERRLDERLQRYQTLAVERDGIYRSLDLTRGRVFNERHLLTTTLTQQLAPHVRVSVERSASQEGYVSAIVAALRGSGLHYNNLAPQVANRIAPIELATWVERADSESLSEALGIATDRAATLIAALRSSGVSDIVSAPVEDRVTLELLDGSEYKPSDRLSIGQRCTVILPLLFGSHGDPLIIDQPEDHLDNAFIASTLVRSLRARGPWDQYILTSHNANIPVLGEADHVVAMESDGRRGYVRVRGQLDDVSVVASVTAIMEGGTEAFARRAQFYGASGV